MKKLRPLIPLLATGALLITLVIYDCCQTPGSIKSFARRPTQQKTLSWEANASAQQIDAYKVYRHVKQQQYQLLATTQGTNFAVAGNIKRLKLVVTAVNVLGESPYSQEIQIQ